MIKVGITIGDPSGIGPIITAKALKKLRGEAQFVVIGDPNTKLSPGEASIRFLDESLRLLKNKSIDCLVTCPISKEAINQAGYKYSGHTEYFADKTGVKNPVMMLLNKDLKFSLVTRHVPLKDVSAKLNRKLLEENIIITRAALKKLFAVKRPRLVICGLNPHASDNGVIGEEENAVIKPVLAKLHLDGPLSSDVAIQKAYNKEYDCVIAMYHDQALIPLKLTDASSGVNITLGLPFIRTSPLHGTAFDIVKTPHLADPSSLIAAIKLAIKCASNLKKA